MSEKIQQFIEAHFAGLCAILMFLFYLIINLLPKYVQRLAKYELPLFDAIFIVLGTGLVIYEVIPKQVDSIAFRFRYWLTEVTDRLTPTSTCVIIIALIAIGFYLRFNNLGDRALWCDEAATLYASIGVLQHGAPVMPSGELYPRSFLNHYLIAQSFRIFGISEFSGRIVSVIFGTLSIPLVYLLGKELGRRTGLIATLLITFSAFEMLWAREARMYAQFQFFYLLTAYLFYMSLKKDNYKLFLLSVIPFIFAWYSHRLTLCFIPVAFMCIILCKRREFLRNNYFVYATVGVTGLALVYMMVRGKTPLDYLPLNVQLWAQHTVLHYVFAFVLTTLLILVFISTAISLLLWKFEIHRDRAQLYFVLNFFIPFIFLCVYPWRYYRYAFFIFPFLVILASNAIDFYALQNGMSTMWNQLSNKLKLRWELIRKVKNVIIMTFILLLFIQVASDSYLNSQDSYANIIVTRANWKEAGEFVNEHLDDDDKIAATVSLTALYYIGRVDYLICQYECPEYANSEEMSRDWYTGALILDDYTLFMQKVKTEKGWLIADQGRLDGYWTDQKVRDYIRKNMTYYPEGSDETIEVYSWGTI
jgi:uncharacterized membrane protein